MKNWIFLPLVILAFGCTHKKVNLNGTEPIKINDFIAAFHLIETQFGAADSTIQQVSDTTLISLKVLTQFIPDSTLATMHYAEKSVNIHPVGRIEKQKEIYLLISFIKRNKKSLCAFVFDKNYNFLAGKELITSISNDDYNHSLSINKEPTFMISREKLNSDKQLLFSRIGWIYNAASKSFMVVLNDSNEDENKNNTVINPIDTLPEKNKLSGNYSENHKNFISLRDGKDLSQYYFFIHIEKNDGSCSGELKGILKLKSPETAVYAENGDPCIIDFTFDGPTIQVKEKGSCGNRRGMQCFFDDTFKKVKEKKTGRKK